jgi:hypothetical protein
VCVCVCVCARVHVRVSKEGRGSCRCLSQYLTALLTRSRQTVCADTQLLGCACAYTCTLANMQNTCISSHVHTHTSTHARTHTHAHVHALTHTFGCMRTLDRAICHHTQTCTHTQVAAYSHRPLVTAPGCLPRIRCRGGSSVASHQRRAAAPPRTAQPWHAAGTARKRQPASQTAPSTRQTRGREG